MATFRNVCTRCDKEVPRHGSVVSVFDPPFVKGVKARNYKLCVPCTRRLYPFLNNSALDEDTEEEKRELCPDRHEPPRRDCPYHECRFTFPDLRG